MSKTVLLLGNPFQSLTVAEDLFDQGYAIFADSKTAHLLNQNMIPANAFHRVGTFAFDLVVQS